MRKGKRSVAEKTAESGRSTRRVGAERVDVRQGRQRFNQRLRSESTAALRDQRQIKLTRQRDAGERKAETLRVVL